MYQSRYGRGPSPAIVVLVAVVMVFGGYLLWTGFTAWIDLGSEQARIARRTEVIQASETAAAFFDRPTIIVFPSITPIPECEYFVVRGPQPAFVRECPSTTCKDVGYVDPEVIVCTVGRADDPQYTRSSEWLKVILEPDEILPKIVFMHQSVLRALKPTPTPTPTFEPLPTVTPTPTPSRIPSAIPATPDPRTPSPTPSPVPIAVPSATIAQIEL
jgi:hypothetical protein